MKRTILLMTGVAIFTAVMLSLPSLFQKDDGILYLYNWTYYTPDEVLRQFEEEYNCTVKVDTYDSNEVMYAKLKAGAQGYDIAFPSQDFTSLMINQGMVEQIDHDKFPNIKYINPACEDLMTFDPNMEYQVPYYFGMSGIAVNKQKVTDYEKSWNIFARKDLKGHMTMMDDMREVIGDALVYQGESVNTTDMDKLKKAADLINTEWKPNLVKFDAEGFGKSFAAGDFWVCQGYAEIVYGEVAEDKQDEMIDFFIPAEGGPSYLDSMVILKGTKHYDRAMDFINFIHRPDIYVQFLDAFRFPGYVNLEAEALRTTKPMYKAEEMSNGELKLDVGDDLEKFNDMWETIRFTAE